MTVEIPVIPADVKREDYWLVLVKGVEWLYLLKTYVLTPLENINVSKKPFIVLPTSQDIPLFMLNKQFVSASTLATITGMAIDDINKAPILKLIASEVEGLAKPTVEYWGLA